MDVDKLFKLPKLPQSSVNKRKWREPDADALKAARVEDDNESNNAFDLAQGSTTKQQQQHVEHGEEESTSTNVYEEDEDEEGRFFGGGLTAQQTRIVELMHDADAEDDVDSVSPESELKKVRKILLDFERSLNRNQEMRAKNADRPEMFMESEVNLYQSIRSLVELTTNPALFYPELIRQRSVASLCELLTHENIDISACVIEILEEMTDDDVLDAGVDGTTDKDSRKGQIAVDAFVASLLDHSLLDMVVQTLRRLATDDREQQGKQGAVASANADSDAATTFHLLGLLENLVSLRPELADSLCAGYFSRWIARQLSSKRTFDQIKAYAAELLCILLHVGSQDQIEQRVKRFANEQAGIDLLLQSLSSLRKRTPSDDEEREYMENVFDALCVALSVPEVKEIFAKAEGIELMCLIMKKDKSFTRSRALKVVRFATSGVEGSENCVQFVRCKGLKYLFDVWTSESASVQDEEGAIETIVSMFNNLASESDERKRFLRQFTKQPFENVDKLVEMHTSAFDRLRREEGSTADKEAETSVDADEEKAERYLRRIEGGLFTLQHVDYALAWLVMESDVAFEHVQLLLRRRNVTLAQVVDILKEYHENVDESVIVATSDDPLEAPLYLGQVIVELVNYLLAVL